MNVNQIFVEDFRGLKLIKSFHLPDDKFIKWGNSLYLSPKNFNKVNRYFKLKQTWYGRTWLKIIEYFNKAKKAVNLSI